MKVRSGFVSNSSSSSFCIVGKCFEWNDKRFENLQELCEKNNANYSFGISDDEEFFVGLSIDNMKDEETLLDFKKQALKEVKKIDPTATVDEIGIIVDSGFDG